tara:strand:+ start:2416 stop:2601 length:186 start_codon:yes stop_codon:yes gene_type:complete
MIRKGDRVFYQWVGGPCQLTGMGTVTEVLPPLRMYQYKVLMDDTGEELLVLSSEVTKAGSA